MSAKQLLVFTYGALGALVQVDFPEFLPTAKGQPKPEKPEPFERSCEGAVYFRPGSTVTLTKTEHEYLVGQHPDVAKWLLYVGLNETPEARLERLKAESAKAHNQPSSVVVRSSVPEPPSFDVEETTKPKKSPKGGSGD